LRWERQLNQSEAYIRLVINDGIVAVGGDERGGMTTVANFQQLLREREEAVGDVDWTIRLRAGF
jgi:hypothetical protein